MERQIRIEKLSAGIDKTAGIDTLRDHLQLLWIRGGKGDLEIHYKHYKIQPQRIFFLPQGQRIQIDWQGTGWLIRLEPWLLRLFFQRHPEEKLLPLFLPAGRKCYTDIIPATAHALQSLAQFIQQEQEAEHNLSIAQTYLYAILLHVANAYRLVNKIPKVSFNYAVAEKLLPLIQEHFHKERLPAFYASQLGMPVRKLNETCKRATGKLVQEWITEQLLSEAERLLAESPLSIKEIAYELDFADMAQFNHFLKKHNGQSPTAFRQALQTDKRSDTDGQAG
ncbi:AraC family transcriptional regulator [Mucilaginibacter paludis]|uniref:Transcriptional regulator, AraC family n=1 Tax=Mucilaginibacter paludis DSM 18603 TaxID=714943 RepID=H1Y3H2_9SPHI|nr:AraC family transcriptional regulator [Mucilaginibacter paludis]EHQ29740.1 transcriptional regulator, AraC family [Mucilaginibacter paludis DSM 18603]